MDTLIPDDVLAHLEALTSAERNPFAGGFTTAQVADRFDISADLARDLVRQLLRDGKLYARRQGLTQDIANRLGYLAGCSIPVYYPIKEA